MGRGAQFAVMDDEAVDAPLCIGPLLTRGRNASSSVPPSSSFSADESLSWAPEADETKAGIVKILYLIIHNNV